MQFIDTPEDTKNQVTWDYGYDWLNRLTSVSKDSVTQSLYAYDESDNRIELEYPQLSEVWTFSYDIADQLLEYGLNTHFYGYFDHDSDGNMTRHHKDGVDTFYDWDLSNRLVGIRKDAAPKVSQSYDVEGIRRSQREDGGQTCRFFSSGGMSLCDTRPSGPVSFLQGHQLLGLELHNNGSGEKMRFYVTDGLGSVRLVVGEDGVVLGEFQHDEFGKELVNTAPSELGAHAYVGALGVRNDPSGLLYMRQRYYDPQLGRWLSADPIGFDGGLNLYTYVNQNPVNGVDPSGLGERDVLEVVVAEAKQVTAPMVRTAEEVFGKIPSYFVECSAYGGPASAQALALRSILLAAPAVFAPIGPGLGSGTMPQNWAPKSSSGRVSVAAGSNPSKLVGFINDQSTIKPFSKPIATGQQINDVRRLINWYGQGFKGEERLWRKKGGKATLVKCDGTEVRNAEIHWYEDFDNRYEYKWQETGR